MRTISIFLALILIAPFALGDGILAQDPVENATVEQGTSFTFSAVSTYRDTLVTQCKLLLDGETAGTLTINDNLGGILRRFTPTAEPGTYTWSVACETDAGDAVASAQRTVHITAKEESVVEVTSSGVTRGSMLRSFEMRNTLEQAPITVEKVAPGDYIGITVLISPSDLTREYYVKNRNVQNGNAYLTLTWKQESYRLDQGVNVTLPVGTSKVIAQFIGLENNRAIITFYPFLSGRPATETPAEETPQEEELPPAEEAPPAETPAEQPAEETPPVESPPPQAAPRQGFFSWLFSLLARLFGE